MQTRVSFILLLLLFYCGIKQPIEITEDGQNTGTIFVTANEAGANIFLDNVPTPYVTPDTLKNITVGRHLLRIFKDGFRAAPESILVNVEKHRMAVAQFTLEAILRPARILVTSQPAHAEIFLAGETSGKHTPDTLIVPAGQNIWVSLKKNGYQPFAFPSVQPVANALFAFEPAVLQVQPLVLLEGFANTSCLPCTTTSRHLEDLENLLVPKNYTLIEYYSNWPNPQDIFYLANPADNMARIQAYKITAVPSVLVAGKGTDPLDLNKIIAAYQSSLAGYDPAIGLSLSRQACHDSIKIQIEIYAPASTDTRNWRLYIALVEDNIQLAQAPGANGAKHFRAVFRKFLTANTGDPVTLTAGSFVAAYSTILAPAWQHEALTIVGFVQDLQSKRIIQVSSL